MKRYLTPLIAVFAVMALMGQQAGKGKLEQYLEIELLRIEEAHRLLDRFAEKIWPGWDNWHEIEVKVRFPNNVHLLVNPRKAVPEGYEQVPGRSVKGKAVFVNRKEELPMTLSLPLIGGGGGGLTIRLRLLEAKVPPQMKNRYFRASDDQVLVYVHEFFHGFQKKFAVKKGVDWDALDSFSVNSGCAAYAHIEGLALLNAWNEKDRAKAFEYFQDYSVAREIKQTFMPAAAVLCEQYEAVLEGTASYANIKMALLIRDEKYKGGISRQEDPFFFNYKFIEQYIEKKMTQEMTILMETTLDKLGKCYTYGAFHCFLLDRFFPGWKQNFFQEQKSLDEVSAALLKLSPQEKREIALRLKSKYPFDDIYAKHDAVVKERDEALAMIKGRIGRKYIVDFSKVREFPLVKPRGKAIRIGVEQIFLSGIERLTVGEVELIGKDTPMHRPWLYTFEWVDTEGGKDRKGYQIASPKSDQGIYKNLVLKTGGFTLKVPEAEIREDKEKNEVRILILRKVSR